MTEHSSWKFAEWPELAGVVDGWAAEAWGWDFSAVFTTLTELGWSERKTARDMLLFTTTLSPGTEAVLRLDNNDKAQVRSIALVTTSVVTAHESNTTKAKVFLARAYANAAAGLEEKLGGTVTSSQTESQWDIINGHLVLVNTKRSIRLTFFSARGFEQAKSAAKTKAEVAGREKKKKAPAPWRVKD